MTLYTSNFESGTPGSRFDWDTPAQGTVTDVPICQNDWSAHGTRSIRINCDNAYQYPQKNLPAAVASVALRWYTKLDQLNTTAEADLCKAYPNITDIASEGPKVYLDSTNHLNLKDANSGSTVWTSSAALLANTSYRIELWVIATGTGTTQYSIAYYIGDNTSPVETFTSAATFTSPTLQSVHFGKVVSSAFTPAGSIIHIDDCAVDDAPTGFIGPTRTPLGIQSNSFDNGVNGNPANTSGIASSGYGFHVDATGSPVFSSADALHGNLAIEMTRGSSNTFSVFTNNALSTIDAAFSFMFEYGTTRPDSLDYLLDVRTSSASLVRLMCTASTGIPFVQILGSTAGTGATALTAGTKYRVDVRIHISDTAGYVFIDFFTPFGTSPLFTGFALTSKNIGTSNIQDVFYGPSGGNSVTVGKFIMDLCRFDDTQSSAYMAIPTGSSVTFNGPRTQIGFWAQKGQIKLEFNDQPCVIGFGAVPGVLTLASAGVNLAGKRATMGFAATPGVLTMNTLGAHTFIQDPATSAIGFAAVPGKLSFSNVVKPRTAMGFAAVPGVLKLASHDPDVFISFGQTDRPMWSFGRADTP